MKIRPERVAQRMRREVAEILEAKLRDPRITGMVSVTDVEVNKDLTLAIVFVSVLATEEEAEKTLQVLAHAAPFVRHELAQRLGLREMPEVRFKLDTSIQHGARVDELLRKLRDHEPLEDSD
ncbi:MAG: 30S ribosome-binding factor RbfA [Candidatus Eisenbacteria bacterium]|uniref:Ribosome-binding factor A n=1 Tax=Eiseniibacteriota bacterium TaxID=2212470 RepID=A0A849SNF9_UNCEI|nr:30S ribosome-binding factor RbfA [Candidatus Eisenbacteria bacterium]